jgi:hypothetical protein
MDRRDRDNPEAYTSSEKSLFAAADGLFSLSGASAKVFSCFWIDTMPNGTVLANNGKWTTTSFSPSLP